MDFTERLELYQNGGMIDQNDVNDILNVIKMFNDKYSIELKEENSDFFIAHLCAAYGRNKTGDEIESLPSEVNDELTSLETYDKSVEMLNDILAVTSNPLSEVEKQYILLHINNLLASLAG